jgi:Zn-finger nucleic acid-binding protein
MAKCTHCSAPLPHKSIICDYCGVRNDIELQAKSESGLPKSKRTCPDCMVQLDSIDIGENDRFVIEKCERCFGLFFDHNELESLLEKSVAGTYWINRQKLHSLIQHPLHKDTVLYRKCPECSKIMQRKNYMNRSGVIMDVCLEHGVWLDAGELKQIQEWIALGGKKSAEEEMLNQEDESAIKIKNFKVKKHDRHYSETDTFSNRREPDVLENMIDILGGLLRNF